MRLVVDGWVPNPEFLTQLLPNLLFKLPIKKKINPDSLSTVLCDTNGAEVQQRLALSASLPASAKVLYYGILLQSRVTRGNIASEKLAPERDELLHPWSTSDNLSETGMYVYKDRTMSVVANTSSKVRIGIPILCW